MLSRLAARLVTGPLAFVLGGILDALRFLAVAVATRWRSRVRRSA